jgi:hypothetical protein
VAALGGSQFSRRLLIMMVSLSAAMLLAIWYFYFTT